MNRAKHQRAYAIQGLQVNLKSGLYEITENEINYAMPLETTRLLKKFFSNGARVTVAEWYKQLPKTERDTVIRSGKVGIQGDDFYPDRESE